MTEVLAPLYCGVSGVQRRSLILKIAELPVRLKLFLEVGRAVTPYFSLRAVAPYCSFTVIHDK